MITCEICGEITYGGQCPNCGYESIVMLDGDERLMQEYIAGCKKKTAESVRDISVKTYDYAENSTTLRGTGKCRIANGADCYGKVVYAAESFAKNPGIGTAARALTVSYKVNGKEKTVNVSIKPPKSGVSWRVGVKIDENLKLAVYISSGSEVSHTDNIKLDLK